MADIKALKDIDGNVTYVEEGSVADDGTLQYIEIPELEIEIDPITGETTLPDHTHEEADITDLDKYTQSEIDTQQGAQDTIIAANTVVGTSNAADITTNKNNLTQEITDRTNGDSAIQADLDTHEADTGNPHSVTQAQVGLANVDNTSDLDKPISTATQTALDLKTNDADLEDVAKTGDYNDLINLPTIPSPTGNTPCLIPQSGRFYFYADTRWVTESDDNYGSNYFQMLESGGTGANPIVEWEHLGTIVPSNRVLSRLFFYCRANTTQVTDFEISIQVRTPNPLTRYQTGVDNDAEMTNVEIYRGNFVELGFAGNMVDRRLKEINLNDYLVSDHSQISIYLKPIGTLTATRFLTATWTWEIK